MLLVTNFDIYLYKNISVKITYKDDKPIVPSKFLYWYETKELNAWFMLRRLNLDMFYGFAGITQISSGSLVLVTL